MRPQEVELWAREIIAAVTSGQAVEDIRVELKAAWIDPASAARRLAGHANAARGIPILWLIGVDERNRALAVIDSLELGNWYGAVRRHFDGEAPRLLVDVSIRVDGHTVVALLFETEVGAPYVITNPAGGQGSKDLSLNPVSHRGQPSLRCIHQKPCLKSGVRASNT